MNNKVKFLRGTSNEYAVAEKDSDTIYFTTDDGKLYIGDKEISGGKGGELPVASTDVLGGVMVDGTSITADENGVISAVGGGGLTLLGRYANEHNVYTTIGTISNIPEGTILVFISTSQSSGSNGYTCFYIGSTVVPFSMSSYTKVNSYAGIVSSLSGTVSLKSLSIENDGTNIKFYGSNSFGTYFDIYKLEV